MKKYLLLLILLINGIIPAQGLKLAILSDIASKRGNSDLTADSLYKAMNSYGEVNSLISLGNLTTWGSYREFEDVKYFLDSLMVKANVLGGPNDFQQHIPGFLNFKKHFEDENFLITEGNVAVIGLQAIDLINNNKGHLSAETLDWLKTTLSGLKDNLIILFLNSEIEKIDNAEKLTAYLKDYSVVRVITPDFADKFKKVTKTRNRRASKKIEPIPLFHTFDIRNDSIFVYKYLPETGFSLVEKKSLVKTDLNEIFKVTGKKGTFKTIINANSSTVTKILSYNNNFIISNLDGKITSYNPDYTIKWKFDIGGNLVCSPLIAGNRLIAASTLGEIFVLDPDTKNVVQSIGTNSEIVSPLLIIDYQGNRELLIPKSGNSKDAIIFGTTSGEIYCYDLETLQELWINEDSKTPIAGNAIVTGNKLIFKNYEGKVLCIDTRTGLLNWRWGYKDLFADTQADLLFNGKQIITLTNNKDLNGIDVLLGVSEWQTEKNSIIDFSLTPGNSNIIAALSNKYLTFYDSKKGKKIKNVRLKEKDITSFLKTDNSINEQFLLSDNNDLFRLEKSNALKKTGNTGPVSVVSFYKDQEDNLNLLNFDGQLLNLTRK